MPTKTVGNSYNIHALLHEHLDIMLAECNRIIDHTENRQILNHLKTFFLDEGQTFTNKMLQHKLQERVQHVEQTEPQSLDFADGNRQDFSDYVVYAMIFPTIRAARNSVITLPLPSGATSTTSAPTTVFVSATRRRISVT